MFGWLLCKLGYHNYEHVIDSRNLGDHYRCCKRCGKLVRMLVVG